MHLKFKQHPKLEETLLDTIEKEIVLVSRALHAASVREVLIAAFSGLRR